MTGTETAMTVKADPGEMFTEGFVDAAGFHVRYLSAGDGPAVLYLPGAGGPVMTYALDALAERGGDVGDLCGEPIEVGDIIGLVAPQIAHIATALGLDRFHLMGTSFGGACALHFVAAHPERVESLVLEAPGKFREASVHPSTLSPEEFVQAFRSHPERVPHMSPPDPAFMERVWPTVERLMGDGADDGLLTRLADVPTRTLILFGRDDGIINPINGRTLRRTLRNSSLQYVFDAAHDVQSDRPEAFVDVVGDFLDRGMRFLINYDDGLINP